MDIKALRNFIKIAEAGSISKAAKELHLSQPPLTKQMQGLETDLGVQLFERSAKGIDLTEEGKLLYSHATYIISYSDMVTRELSNINGIIRCGTTTSSVEYSLSMIKQFNPYSLYQFEITEANTYQLLEMLENNLIDAAFVRSPFKFDRKFNYVKLTRDSVVVAGSPVFLEEYGSSISIKDLAELPIIVIRRWKEYIDNAVNTMNIPLQYQYICDDNRTALSMAYNNMGVAILPSSTIDRRQSRQYIMEKQISDGAFDTSVFIVYKADRKFNKQTTGFINFMVSKALKE